MRTLQHFFFALLILSSLAARAQWRPTANLTVFSEDGERFYLILNGERYNDIAQTNIRIEELPNPYYNCKIVFENRNLPAISKSALMLTDANNVMQDVTYRIKRDNKGRNVLRFYSFVPARQNMPRPANCVTYRFGSPNIVLGLNDFRDNDRNNYRDNRNNGFRDNERDNRNNDFRDNDDYYRDDNRRNTRNNNNNNNFNNRNGGRGGCNFAMNTNDFNEAKSTIANNSFDETKLSTAKQIISSNCVNASQINTLLNLFSFESSKLDFAKFAYQYCVDRNNYFKVSNSFTFESSKTELNEFIQSNR